MHITTTRCCVTALLLPTDLSFDFEPIDIVPSHSIRFSRICIRHIYYYADLYTLIHCESRLHILGVTPSLFKHYLWFQVRHLLLDPSSSNTPYGLTIPTSFLGMNLSYFVPVFLWLSSLGFIYPPMWANCASRKSRNFVNLGSSRYFGLQGVVFDTTSLYPLLRP